MEQENDVLEIDLLHIFELLLSKIWVIIATSVISAAIGFSIASFMITPKYQSSALFYVNNNNLSIGSTSLSISSSDISASKSLVDTYIVILKTRNTLEKVIQKADLPYTYEQLSSMVSASSVNSTEVFKVTVTTTDPNQACVIANAIADVLPDKISEIVAGTGAKVVDYAVVDKTVVSPSVKKYTAIGGLVGFVLICMLIVIRDMFDNTITTDSYLINTYKDIPTIATIPNLQEHNTYDTYNYGYYKEEPKK